MAWKRKKGKRGSWKSGWFTIGGQKHYYRSSWEVKYARYLEKQKKAKKIIKWDYECDTFWFDKIKRGTKSYLPDFKVFHLDESIEYHEVKGWMDSKSKTKINRMRIYHPDIKLIVLQKKELKDLGLDI